MRNATLSFVAALVLSCASARTRPDRATAPRDRHATLLFFADAHGDLETHTELFWRADGTTDTVPAGGYARLATAVERARRDAQDDALLVDGGDTFQGSAAAAWSRGEAILGPQNALGVDLGVPGNWEVVYGAPRLRELVHKLNYPVLAANVFDAATGALVFPASFVRERGGIRIGFVGYTDPDVPQRQSPSYSRGLRFEGPESLPPVIERLHRQDHVDLVVLITHVGLARAIALADRLQGVDVVLSADSHERTYVPIVRHGVVVVEPGSFASFLGRLDVRLGPDGRPHYDWSLGELRADRVPEDPHMRRVVDAALMPYRARLDAVIGDTATPLERYGVIETRADDVLADAVREATGADIALSNGFRFGHPIAAGPIREADLWMLYPVTSRVKTGTVTGAQLRAFWESEIEHVFATDPTHLFGGWLPRVSGMTVRFRADAPAGQRVESITVGGRMLDPARRYSIAACEREGEQQDTLCRIPHVDDPRVIDVDNHDVVRAYLAHHPHLSFQDGDRVVAMDRPHRMFSQFLR